MFFKSKKPVKVALVLGGGGARGMAHIGVLKVFERENIPIDMIVGTSAGALFGGMYCQSHNARSVEERLAELVKSDIYEESGLKKVIKKQEDENFFDQLTTRLKERIVVNMAYSREGIVKHNRLRKVIDFLLPDLRIEACKVPFYAIAVDLISAKEMIFSEGSIRTAVDASSSLPGYFAPVEYDGKLLVDGAVLQVVPVPAAKELGADFVIAVNVSQELEENPVLDNVIKIIFRSSAITGNRYNKTLLNDADVVLRPQIGHLHWSEFEQYEEAIAKGEQVARLALPIIRKKLKSYRRKKLNLRQNIDEKLVEVKGTT